MATPTTQPGPASIECVALGGNYNTAGRSTTDAKPSATRRSLNYVTEKGIDKRVKILFVNPDADTHIDTIYDLRASPTLYLLDKGKKVILKDASIEQIEQYLTTQ